MTSHQVDNRPNLDEQHPWSEKLTAIQAKLAEDNIDGWLFFDHHLRDPLAYSILGLPSDGHISRRWFYLIPKTGSPRGIVHKIEAWRLNSLPGTTQSYSSWRELHLALSNVLKGLRSVAMQYSPRCAIPAVSMVDAGTIELINSIGVQVVSSANLIQLFQARLTPAALESHFEAGRRIDEIRQRAFELIRDRISSTSGVTELEVKEFILSEFHKNGLVTAHGPDVAANSNSSDPHYDPKPGACATIKLGDFVLIDMWAKLDSPGAIYYDITWCGFCGARVPAEIENVFSIVKGARDTAIAAVSRSAAENKLLRGFEVDDVTRDFISSKGYGEYFTHRTGHSIGEDVHGSGAHMDNFETCDERVIVPNTCFSIEPGIYLKNFGIRSEVNMVYLPNEARVTGEVQEHLLLLS